MEVMTFKHKSVLLEETIENLNIKPDGIYVDGTLGGAGHASEVCKRLSSKGRFFGFDQDADAIEAAGERLKEFGDQVTIIRSNYCNMAEELKKGELHQLMEFCWIWEYPPINWTMPNAVLPIARTRRLTCVWTRDKSAPPLIL